MELRRVFIANVEHSGSRAFLGTHTDEERLVRVKGLKGGGKVIFVGLLALGYYPQQFEPKLVIDVAVHPGFEKGSNPETLFLDHKICDGACLWLLTMH